ncbi:MAG: PP2C family serine/threonine-protein phosphatase [Pseudomonadota bacterium]
MDNLQFAFKTHIGNRDAEHKDSFVSRDNLFIVVEGLGGEYLSEIARELACQVIHQSFFKYLSEVQSPGTALEYAIKEANEAMLDERKKLGMKMAASVSVLYIKDKIMYFAHLGDSRIYSVHKGELNQLTRDHLLQEDDSIPQERLVKYRGTHALTEGLGIHENPKINVKRYLLHGKNTIFMTTEGLTRRVSNREILIFSLKTKNLERLCRRLIDIAIRKGGTGKMTIGIIRFGQLSGGMKKIIIIYSTLFLLILSFFGVYTLKYRVSGQKEEKPHAVQPVEKGSDKKKETAPVIAGTTSTIESKMKEQPVKEEKPQESEKKLEDTIYAFLSDWKSAWEKTAGENGNMATYISFYSDNFSSSGLKKDGWRRDKGNKGRRKDWIRVEVSNIQIYGPDEKDQVKILFDQDYRSSSFTNKSQKTLVLKNEGTGWKIIAEKSS